MQKVQQMKHLPILISITIIAFLANACKYECPGFDRSLLSWMPQNEGDTLNYVNKNTDTLTFVVEKKDYSKSFKIERQNKKSCYSDANLYSKNQIHNSEINFSIVENWNNVLSICVNLYLLKYYETEKQGELCIETQNINNIIEALNIENKAYKEAIIFENDTINDSNNIYKAIIANNYGLIKFYEKSGVEWSLLVD